MSETFTYDNLHRVLSRTVISAANLSGNLTLSESYAYDGNGNLLSKGNVGYYQYNVANKPNCSGTINLATLLEVICWALEKSNVCN